MKDCKQLNDDLLRVLLYDQEDSLETIEIARHVESCETCQIRLTEMVNEESIEQEANQLLSSYSESERSKFNSAIFPASSSSSNRGPRDHDSENQEQDFDKVLLEPPTHPEMLGRIGRYEIERRIGSGGMGVVFKAFDTELNRPVAVKVLAPHLARNGAARQRFNRESRAAAAVVHEHVVAIHNVDSNAAHPYLVMQYVCGESLQSRVEREGPLCVDRILRIGIQTALGLSAAHQQGIVHRDIKPANILLEDGVDRLLITDFGLARTVDDASLTHTGVVAGTPNYMSPEQASGDEVDHRTDLFSLGSVLYFVATGHPPFRAERAMGVLHRICRERHRPVWQVNSAITDELSAVIDRLLEKKPAKRFDTATAVAESLTRILQRSQNRRPGFSSRLRAWGRRHHYVSWLAASILLAGSGWLLVPTMTPGLFDKGRDGFASEVVSTRPLKPNEVISQSAESTVDSLSNNAQLSSAGRSPRQAVDNSAAVAALLTDDRGLFDRDLKTVFGSLSEIDSRDNFEEPDSFVEFKLKLNAIGHSLQQIDPTYNSNQ